MCVSLNGHPRFVDSPRLVCPYVLRTRRNAAPHVQVTAGKLREWQLRHRVQEGSRASSKHARLHGPLLVPDISGLSRFVAPLMFQGVCVCFRGCTPSRTLRPAQLGGGRERGPANGGREQAGAEGVSHGGSPHGPLEGKTLAGLGQSNSALFKTHSPLFKTH